MIFLILGTQQFPFNRLLRLVDEHLASGAIRDRVVAQTGCSDYAPEHIVCHQFLDKPEFERHIRDAELIIAHGGVGSIVSALQKNKPVIVFPRLVRYREHVDDHQAEIARAFAGRGHVLHCEDGADLPRLVEAARNFVPKPYVSQTQTILDEIERYLSGR